MDYSPPGSPVHGILRARILEWVAISFSMFCFVFLQKAYFTEYNVLRFTHVETCMRISSLLLLNNIPLYRDTTLCLFTRQLLDTWGASTFGLL